MFSLLWLRTCIVILKHVTNYFLQSSNLQQRNLACKLVRLFPHQPFHIKGFIIRSKDFADFSFLPRGRNQHSRMFQTVLKNTFVGVLFIKLSLDHLNDTNNVGQYLQKYHRNTFIFIDEIKIRKPYVKQITAY